MPRMKHESIPDNIWLIDEFYAAFRECYPRNGTYELPIGQNRFDFIDTEFDGHLIKTRVDPSCSWLFPRMAERRFMEWALMASERVILYRTRKKGEAQRVLSARHPRKYCRVLGASLMIEVPEADQNNPIRSLFKEVSNRITAFLLGSSEPAPMIIFAGPDVLLIEKAPHLGHPSVLIDTWGMSPEAFALSVLNPIIKHLRWIDFSEARIGRGNYANKRQPSEGVDGLQCHVTLCEGEDENSRLWRNWFREHRGPRAAVRNLIDRNYAWAIKEDPDADRWSYP